MSPRSLCLVTAAALIGGVAQAASSATAGADLSNLQIQLVDLNPGDGISPWISFGFGPQSNQGSANASWSTSTASQSASGSFFSDANPWKAGSTSAVTGFASSSASLSGSNMASGSSLSASGQASSPGNNLYDPNFFFFTSPSASFSASVQAPSFFQVPFQISPFTVVVFSATVSVQAVATEGGFVTDPWNNTYGNGNSASANASLSVSGPAAGGGNGSQNASDGRSVWVASSYDPWSGSWTSNSASESGFAGVSFTNLTMAAMDGNFRAEVSVNGTAYGNTAPIPEPGTWALMLAGLAVVSRIATRRR